MIKRIFMKKFTGENVIIESLRQQRRKGRCIMKKYFVRGLMVGLSTLMLSGLITQVDAMGWRHYDRPIGLPRSISLAEPATLGLLAAGIAGVGVYLFLKRSNRK